MLPAAAQETPKTRPEPVAVARPAPVIENRPAGGYFSPGAQSVFSSDPSYVFFRQIPDSEQGPVGALGVPLTAGRSIAVDPRTTPLGFPVFISTGGAAQPTDGRAGHRRRHPRPRSRRLLLGFGPSAYEQASRMKENGRMWLLMPNDAQRLAVETAVSSRAASRAARAPTT